MKKILLPSFIFFAAFSLKAQIGDGLVGYWRFDNDLTDSTLTANNGIGFGGITFTIGVNGASNGALNFDGIDDYVDISDNVNYHFGLGDFTLTFWFSSSSTNGVNQIISKCASGFSGPPPWYGIAFYINSDEPGELRARTQYANSISSDNSWNDGQWHHVVFTRSGTSLSLFIDGNLKTSSDFVPADDVTNSFKLVLGRNQEANQYIYQGKLDNLRLYNNAFTQQRVAELYNFEQNTNIPSATISNKSKYEGNSGTSEMKFKVTLTHASNEKIKITYTTQDNTATAGSDYEAKQGTLIFQPGQTFKTIPVTINGDVTNESKEKFKVILSNPSNVVLADNKGVGTIKNDDTPPDSAFKNTQTVLTEKLSTGSRIILSPNPATNYVHISGVSEGNILVEIVDINGNTVLKQALSNNSIDVSKLAPGNYIVKLTMKNRTELLRLVKL